MYLQSWISIGRNSSRSTLSTLAWAMVHSTVGFPPRARTRRAPETGVAMPGAAGRNSAPPAATSRINNIKSTKETARNQWAKVKAVLLELNP